MQFAINYRLKSADSRSVCESSKAHCGQGICIMSSISETRRPGLPVVTAGYENIRKMETEPDSQENHPSGAHDNERRQNDLFYEKVASALWYEDPRSNWGPYTVYLVLLFIDIGVLSTIQYIRFGYHPWLTNPGLVTGIPAFLLGILAMRKMRDQYEETVDDLLAQRDKWIAGEKDFSSGTGLVNWLIWRWDQLLVDWTSDNETDDIEPRFRTLASPRVKLFVYLVMLIVYGSWLFLIEGHLEFVLQTEGSIIGPIKFFLLLPFGYIPVVAEFVAIVIGINALLPTKIRSNGAIFFHDPLNHAGLRRIGSLITRSSTYYMGGVLLYVLSRITIDIFVLQTGVGVTTGPVLTIMIGLASVLGLVIFFLPMYTIHRFIGVKKEQKLDDLTEKLEEECGESDAIFPDVNEVLTNDSDRDIAGEYLQQFMNIQKIEKTKTYPTDVSHVIEFLFIVLIPFIAHVFSTVVFEFLHV